MGSRPRDRPGHRRGGERAIKDKNRHFYFLADAHPEYMAYEMLLNFVAVFLENHEDRGEEIAISADGTRFLAYEKIKELLEDYEKNMEVINPQSSYQDILEYTKKHLYEQNNTGGKTQ